MTRGLDTGHPDFGAKVGAERVSNGKTYKFSENQFSGYWKAGPKDGTVVCSKDYPMITDRPYVVGVTYFTNFDLAAKHAEENALAEYRRAKLVVERYEK